MTGPGVVCARPGCGHVYTRHAPGGAHCRVEFGAPCRCHGFQWVDPAASAGSYTTPPEFPYQPGELAQPGTYGGEALDRVGRGGA